MTAQKTAVKETRSIVATMKRHMIQNGGAQKIQVSK